MKSNEKESITNVYIDEDYMNNRMINIHIKEIDSKKNSILKSVFEIFYILLKNESGDTTSYIFHISLAMFMYFTEFMEFMIFAFQHKYHHLWNNEYIAILLSDFWYIPNPIIKVYGASSLAYHIVFYSSCFFVTLMLINIIYIYISIKRNYFSMMWPIFVLNKVCSIVTTILFFPFLEIFVSIFSCVNSIEDGKTVFRNSVSNEIICYENFHYLNLIIGAIFSTLFISICLSVSTLYYQNSYGDGVTAKYTSKADFIVTLSKLIKTIVFTFSTNNYLISYELSVMLVLSFIQVYSLYSIKPYYDKILQSWVCFLNSIYFWTCINLVFSQALLVSNLNNTYMIYIFLLGVPFVCMLFLNDYYKSITNQTHLYLNINEKSSEIEIIQSFFSIQYLISKKNQNERHAIFNLNCFIYNHEKTCLNNNCPLKEYSLVMDSVIMSKNIKLNYNRRNNDYENIEDDIDINEISRLTNEMHSSVSKKDSKKELTSTADIINNSSKMSSTNVVESKNGKLVFNA